MKNENKERTKNHFFTYEFIPYQQALELKELGFDQNCVAYYSADKQQLNLVNGYGSLMFADYVHLTNTVKSVPAPLYQQAFRFFREKYKKRFIIQSGMSDLGEFFKVIFPSGEQRSISYETYEEAELACLVKLIEILKTEIGNI